MDFSSTENTLENFNILEEREASIQSQYSASPRMLGLIYGFREALNPSPDMARFYETVFDLESAQGWGLDNWGRILGIGRDMEILPGDVLGFHGSGLEPFNRAPFYSPSATDYHSLTDDAYRRRLWFKAMANISPSDAATLNDLLKRLYGERPAYILDNQDMTVRAVFEFYLSPFEAALFSRYGLLARAGGVGFEYLQIDRSETFGFAGSGMQSFNQGVFHPYGGIQTGDMIHER